jgi:hypothetical protein
MSKKTADEDTFNYNLIVQFLKDRKDAGKPPVLHGPIDRMLYELRKDFFDARDGEESARTSAQRCLSDMGGIPKSNIGRGDHRLTSNPMYFWKEIE